MPFNGSGVFNRIMNWVNDAANSIPITASRTDTDTNDIAQGLTNCVTRDGQSPALANLPMGGFKLTNVAAASASNEYVTLFQVNSAFVPIAGGITFTGQITTQAAGLGLIVQQPTVVMETTTGTPGFRVTATANGSSSTYMEFVRAGSYSAYFGLGSDNNLRYGGGTVGNVSYKVHHDGLSGAILVSPTIGGSAAITGVTVYSGTNVTQTTGFLSGSMRTILTDSANNTQIASDLFSETYRLFGFYRGGSTSVYLQMAMQTGNCTVSGVWTGPNFIGTSDERLKDDIADFVPRSNLADLIRFVSYVRKASNRYELGVIAQQLQLIAPEYVYEGEDGILGVDKAGLALEVAMGLALRVRELESR